MAKEKDISLKVRPLDDRVVVEPLEAEEKSAGGILLPDTAKQKPQRGRVLAVGPGKLRDNGERMALAVHKGDEVIYGATAAAMSRWKAGKSKSCGKATSSPRSPSKKTNHENTKQGKHEQYKKGGVCLKLFRVFLVSCFRDSLHGERANGKTTALHRRGAQEAARRRR